MRDVSIIIIGAVLACLHGQALTQAQSTVCASNLKYGGTCVGSLDACSGNSFEYSVYSNFIGCGSATKKCCANNNKGPVVNPGGIEVSPSLTCGLGSIEPSSRILEGIVTGPCDWPFSISFRSQLPGATGLRMNDTVHVCQGVLIAKLWVLTSPVCIVGNANTAEEAKYRMIAVAGEYNVKEVDIDPVTGNPQEQYINIDRVIIHPDYAYSTQSELAPFNNRTAINSNGIALVKLAQPINGRCSGVACLPTKEEADNDCANYDTCVITGWGFFSANFTGAQPPNFFENNLRGEQLFGNTRMTSRAACNFLTERLNLTDVRPVGSICQSPAESNTNACLGDEGGAVLCSNGYNWVVRGILPFNICRDGYYDMFVTEMAAYVDWVNSIIGDSSGQSRGR